MRCIRPPVVQGLGVRVVVRRRASAATAAGNWACVLAVVPMSSISTPGTARPMRAPVVARRWSWCARQRAAVQRRGARCGCRRPARAPRRRERAARRRAPRCGRSRVRGCARCRRACVGRVRERGERRRSSGSARPPPTGRGRRPGCRWPGRDGERAAAADGPRAHQRQDLGEHRARLRRVGGPSRHRHRAAGDHRRREERRRVGQVGLDRDVLAADRAGRHDPFAGRRAARRGRRGAPSDSIVMSMCGMLGSRSPRWTRCSPTSKRGAASSRPETNWLDALASIDDLAAAHVPVAAHDERKRPVAAVVDVDADIAQRLDHRAHRAVQGALVRRQRHVAARRSRRAPRRIA